MKILSIQKVASTHFSKLQVKSKAKMILNPPETAFCVNVLQVIINIPFPPPLTTETLKIEAKATVFLGPLQL